MSASPVLVTNDDELKYPLKIQNVIDAVMEFINEKQSGVIEVHFSNGGIAKVFGKPFREYK